MAMKLGLGRANHASRTRHSISLDHSSHPIVSRTHVRERAALLLVARCEFDWLICVLDLAARLQLYKCCIHVRNEIYCTVLYSCIQYV